jgi:hypothetical protein
MMSGDELPLIGAWKLVSCLMEDVETKERKPLWGDRPNGCIIVTKEGQWTAIQTAEGRKAPKTDEDRAAAFRSMLAYSGKYRTEGNKIIINVDIAWDETWTGSEQVRYYRFDGDKLYIESAPQPFANFGGKTMRGILIWMRQ